MMRYSIRNITGLVLNVSLSQLILLQHLCFAQQTNIVLDQGAVVGLKIFPDSSRTAVYAFLGLPYAQPPVGDLRFASPMPHTGWNWTTLQAMSMKPVCPQLTNTIYDETPEGAVSRLAAMDENCLYLNIWVPEAGVRFGNLPVLVIMTGEEMSYDWPRNRATGLDIASEGCVVVTIQYRTNVLGWMSFGNSELTGNYGFQDQTLALEWIARNIAHFGGNANQVTLLGHGTSGAPCALLHALFQTANLQETLFSKVILMSGGDMRTTLSSHAMVQEISRKLVQKLSCHFDERGNQVVSCLRTKSVSDLEKAFESVYDHGNGSLTLGPVVTRAIREMLDNLTLVKSLPPLLLGITSNEGAFLQDYWLDLARESYQSIRSYVNFTVLPKVLRKLAITTESARIMDALSWRYFSGEAAVSVAHLLNAMQRVISESHYETPFYRTLEWLSSNNLSHTGSIYAYIFDANNSMDMRGKVNLFGGASHSSDLPLLLGPSLFQQISRRRFTADEEKLCRKMRVAFVNFVKSGNPTTGRISDAWLPYTKEQKFIYSLGDPVEKGGGKSGASSAVFERNLPQIEKLLENEKPGGTGLSRSNRNDYSNTYQSGASPAVVDSRRTKSASFVTHPQDSGYAMHLKRVYGFWQVLLPNMATYGGDSSYDGINDALSNRMRFMEASASAERYKQGFYAMLGLVAVLLGILGLCVYLLRRDPFRLPARSSGFSL